MTQSEDAHFAVIAGPDDMPALDRFRHGSDEAPETAATLIIQTARVLQGAGGMRLTGPGIRTETDIRIDGVPKSLWQDRNALAGIFPRGIDMVLTDGHRLVALPRTTRIEVEQDVRIG